MKDKENSSKASNLRQIAEENLKNKAKETPSIPAEIDILKLVHELDVHQVELEMLNEELLLAKKNAEFNAEKYQELYDFAPSGYFTLSKEGVILAVNLRGAELLSRERVFLIKSYFTHFISDETRPTFILFLESVFNSKSKQSCEVHISLNKNTITYDVYLTGVTSEDGEQCYITMLDISKLKRAEAEINEKEKKYRTLFDSNRDSVTVFRLGPDGKLGNFIVANKATSEIFGYSNEELMTMTFKKLEPASVKKRKERIAVLLSKKNINFETFIKTKKGNRRNVEVEALIINYENEPAVMNIIRDVTERKQMEANSRKAQENLLTILEAIPDLLFEVDSTGKIYHYQSPHNNLLAVSPSEFMGKSFSEFLPYEVTTIIMDAIREADSKGWSSGKQYALELPQGKFWFELSVSLIKESNTKEKHFIILARDITIRKKAEEKLRFEKERSRTILEMVGNPIFLKDNDHRVTFANNAFFKLFGLDEKNVLGKTLAEKVPENEREHFLRIDRNVLDTGIPDIREEHLTLKGIVHTIITSKTRIIDSFGNKSLVGSIYDITDRKKAEELLQKSQEKISGIFDLANSGIIVTDINGKYLLYNNWCLDNFGFTRQEMNKLSSKDLTLSDDFKEAEILFKNLIEGKIDKYQIEKRFIRKDKSIFWGEMAASAIKDKKGKTVNTIGIITDITERINSEKKIKESEARLIAAQALAKAGSWETDFNFANVVWSKETGKIFGLDLEATKITLEKFLSIVHPQDKLLVETSFVHSIKSNSLNTLEHRIITDDGIEKTVEQRWEILKDEDGQPIRAIGSCQDITERKLAELALTNEKRRLAVILIGTGAGTWEWNIQTGETIFNERWAEIIGYTLEELAPISIDTWEKYTHPDDFKHSEELLEKHFKGELDYYECEVRMKHKNGDWIWIIDRGKINEWDVDGNPLLMSGTHLNVTERKLAENNLLNNQALTDATLESIQSGILAIDHEGKVIKTNNKFVEMWRIPNEIINTKDDKTLLNFILEQLVHPEDFKSKVTELYKNHHEESIDILYFKDGRIFERVSRPMYVEGVTMGRVWSFLDITERKLAEKAKEDVLNLFHNINSHVPGIVYQYLLRPDGSSCFPYASDGIKEIYRVTPEEVREDASKVFKNIHPDDYTALVASIQKSAEDLSPWIHQYCVKYKDGEVRYLLGNAKPQKLVDGSVLWNGYITDITVNKIAENSLRESEEKYRGLIENSPDGVVIYRDGNVVFANEEAFRMVGAKKIDSFLGKPVLQFIHPDSIDSVIKRMKEVILDNKSTEIVEEKFIRLDGTTFDAEIKAIPTIYEHKNAIQVIVHDITQRKQSALELTKINRVYALISQINNLIIRTKNQEELFQEICNIAVNFGKFRMSWIGLIAEDNKILKTATFAGYENGYFTKSNITTVSDEPEGRGPTGIATREGRTVICNDIANDPIMKPWRNDALERGYNSSISIPLMVRNKIIGAFNLYSEETNFFSSEEEISLLEKIILNISFALEKIHIEEDRRKTEEKIQQLSQAVEQSPVTIVITNTKGDIEYANPKFLETSGYTMEEVVGQNSRILKSGYTSAEEYKELWHSLAIGKEWHGEFHNKRKDGSLYWESASISPIVNSEGRTTHYIAIKEDITNRKLIQKELLKSKNKAEESDRLKLAFLANMSHEIRTPMNGILGFTELLKEPKLSGKEQQEYINIIEKSGKRMLNIINDIISISKVESGQIDISLKETNINEQIEYLYTFFNPEAKLKGIQLNLPKMLLAEDSLVKTDREKVYAILTNLVKNAIKFTNEGTIEFGCEKKEGMLEFFVKDSGLGISKSQQKMVFERFRQVNETISRSHEGSGLGLAISKAYAELLGGKIWVKSKEGKGSTFYFTIPFYPEYKSKEITITKKEDTAVKEENKIKNLKVLIVEDDAISKLLVTIAVKPFSKEILKVSTGFEAIEACRNNPDIDLVMMDINMPEMGGYEATKQIRESKKDLIIIAQTANGMQSDRDNAIAAGCTDYISKPINIKTLGELIQKYFKK